MNKIKINLDRQQYLALFNAMKHLSIDMYNSKLDKKAQQEIMQKLYMRLAQRIFTLNKSYSITLNMSESWAFFCTMPGVMNKIGDYEQNTVQHIINTIHQKTI